jgi:hypothetical protein
MNNVPAGDRGQVHDDFATRYRRAKVMWLLWVALFPAAGLLHGGGARSDGPYTYVVLGVAGALIAFHLWNWRCPSCNWYLGNWLFTRQCWHCKIMLR